MNDSEHIARIGSYLDEAMSPNERTAFEAQMKGDSELAQEVKTLQALRDDSRSFYRKEALAQEIANQNKTAIRRPLWRRPIFQIGLALAAGFALIVMLNPGLFTKQPLDHQALFDQYFEVYDESGLTVERGNGASSDIWRDAGHAYRKGAYATAGEGFLSIIQTDSSNISARFYFANSLMAEGKAKQAIPHLQFIIKQNDFLYKNQTRWLLALALIQNGQAEVSIPFLEQLQTVDNPLGIKAKAVLKTLR